MATPYEIEHNISAPTTSTSSRRPDMSTFFSQLSSISTTETPHSNVHAVADPPSVAAAERLLHDQFAFLHTSSDSPHHRAFLESLMAEQSRLVDQPPTKLGVSQSYLDSLDRVPKKELEKRRLKQKKGEKDCCPICNEEFLSAEYPLVVRLPCHESHLFDLDCVGPWLRMNGTCPLDRKELEMGGKEKREVKLEEMLEGKGKEEDEEYDDMFA